MCSLDNVTDVIGSCDAAAKKSSQLNISLRKLWKSVAEVKGAKQERLLQFIARSEWK